MCRLIMGVETKLYTFLSSVLMKVSDNLYAPVAFSLKVALDTRLLRGLMRYGAIFDGGKRNLCHARN
jgi:hypothetical protein